MNRKSNSLLLPFWCVLVVISAGCASPGTIVLPEPLREPVRSVSEAGAEMGHAKANEEIENTRFTDTPKVGPIKPAAAVSDEDIKVDFSNPDRLIEVNVEDMPVPAFINEVFGNLLQQDFFISESVDSIRDVVTFRIATKQRPEEVFEAARQVLASYGITFEVVNGRLHFKTASTPGTGEPPLIVSGRALPQVPVTHRPVFQMVPLRVVRTNTVTVWLRAAFNGMGLRILEDNNRNVVMLQGKPSVVRQAIEMLEFLDQPAMRGRHSVKITPVFWDAQEMANKLKDVLVTEGYEAGLSPNVGGAVLLPVPQGNSILAFAADPSLLKHIKDWAKDLDIPSREQHELGFFRYEVRNTSAERLAAVLSNFSQNVSRSIGEDSEVRDRSNLVVDGARNALVYFGPTEAWLQMLPLIKDMDRADRMVLIEVTIAELTLTDQNQFGIEWLATGDGINGEDSIVSTLGGLSLKEGGFSYTLNSAGQTRALMRAFASNNSINVISTPRVLTLSGYAASIDVGDEVPLVSSQSQGDGLQAGGNSAILQEVQYQSTGVSLNITPIVFSDNKISMEINQSVSTALINETSNIDSPVIQRRSVDTAVTLDDGGSVLVAGLISESVTKGASKVPILGDIPILGIPFKTKSDTTVRTELVILVVPYIISDQDDAEGIRELYQQRLSW